MKYQLVLQWYCSSFSSGDFQRLQMIEGILISGLGDRGVVDGHDIGSGEFNIFIHTNDVKLALSKVKELLGPPRYFQDMRAGYRSFEENEYFPMHPEDMDDFRVK